MDFSARPERRVFHLDTECYIIYIGKDQDDYKPFLRVGNTAALDQDVKALTYSIVVADALPGSPILERDNLSSIVGDEFRYVGDPDTVERFKQFLRHQEFSSDGYEETSDDVLQDMGAYVYFYHDGNVRVTFDKTPVFNLRRREEEDRHYLQRVKTIKNHLLRNPLRYSARQFEKPGFFVLDGRTYFFSRGTIAAFDIPENYFADIAAAGIDPDRISTVYAPDVSEGLVRLFKRVRAKNARIHVITDNPPGVKGIIDLFRAEQQFQLKSEVVKLHPDKFTPALDYRIKKTARHFIVESDSLPAALYVDSELGAVVRNVLSVSSARRGWLYGGSGGAQKGTLLEGVLHQLHAGPPPRGSAGVQSYLPGKLFGLEDMMSQAEMTAYAGIRAFFADFSAGTGDLDGHVRKLRSVSRGRDTGPVWWLLAETARQLALAAAATEHDFRLKSLNALADALAAAAGEPPSAVPPAVVCDLFIDGGTVYPLYRFSESVTPDRVRQSEAVVAAIRNEEQPQDPAHFAREAKRLRQLLDSLDTEKARIRKPAATGTGSDGLATVAAAATAGTAAEKQQTKGDAAERRRSRSRWWPAAALLLLLLGAGLIFFLATDAGRDAARMAFGRTPTVEPSQPAPAPTAPPVDPDAPPEAEEPPADDVAELAEPVDPDAADVEPTDREPAVSEPDDVDPPAVALDEDTDDPFAQRDPGTAAPGTLDTGPPINLAEWEDVEGLEERQVIGGINITVLDIIRLANRIALANGYRQMGAPPRDGPNPLWIYEGNRLVLPDRREITVGEDENLWSLTADFIEGQLEEDVPRFEDVRLRQQEGLITTERFVEQVRRMQEFSNSERFSQRLAQAIREVTRG